MVKGASGENSKDVSVNKRKTKLLIKKMLAIFQYAVIWYRKISVMDCKVRYFEVEMIYL